MNLLPSIEALFGDYGYWVVFIGLLLEFIALPFPGETTMAYSGYLSYRGVLHWEILIVLAFLGTTIGITITYWIGRKAGMPFIHRFGKYMLLPAHKLDKTRLWFEKYGTGIIFISYFIPGVRHFTGYFSGMIALPFYKFAIYAYSGALVWTSLFVGLGKVFGPQWTYVFKLAETYAISIVLFVLVILALFMVIRYRKIIVRQYRKKFVPSKSASESNKKPERAKSH